MDLILFFWEFFINMLENSIYTFLFFKSLKLQGKFEDHKKTVFLIITVVETLLTCLCNFSDAKSITTQLILFGADVLLIYGIFQNTLPKKYLLPHSPPVSAY